MTIRPSRPQTDWSVELLSVLTLTGLIIAFFWKMLSTNLIIARGDLFSYFYPYRDFAAASLREGHVPLWNPYLFMGVPFVANSQAGFFYPFNLASSWLEVTRAVNLNTVIHIWIASLGAYAFARGTLRVSIPAAWLGAISFGLGGYLGAQVEHLNQLQALAWLPWVWLAYERAQQRSARWSGSLVAGVLVGLMVLAGHFQSVFISLVGLTAYALWPALEHIRVPGRAARLAVGRLLPVLVAVVVGALLASVQLLPSFELAQFSTRSRGLPINEAVSFSLDPRLLGRALLPDYTGALPSGSEYTAFVGVSASLLIIVGFWVAWRPGMKGGEQRDSPPDLATVRALSFLTLVGLLLALGGFNPVYYALVRLVPGFDLFRAPARWLALFSFGGSMLAVVGLHAIGRGWMPQARTWLLAPVVCILLLIGLAFAGADVSPAGAAGPVGAPDVLSISLWGGASLVTLQACYLLRPPGLNPQLLVVALSCLELFLATRALPYNARLTAPDALTSLRPSLTQLMSGSTDTMPARFLSISDILFDPGDSAELESIFADQLPPVAYYDLLVASKQKEIVSPNLPLYFRVPAVDGYDGGLLPLRTYLDFQRLFVPSGAIQPDGRLREQLKTIPDGRWLALMNVKYLITDKVRDRWLDGVFFDVQFATQLEHGDEVFTDQLPPLEANALALVYSEPSADFMLAEVELTFADGRSLTLPLTDEPRGIADGLAVTRLRWSEAGRIASVRVRGLGGLTLHGVALVDERSRTFQSFILAQGLRFRLAHSGDVKVYENRDVLPRAFVAPQVRYVASDDEGIAIMQGADFDPSRTVIVTGRGASELPSAARHASRIVAYRPEYVSIDVETDSAAYLVLTDAWYPGWVATVDGEPVEIRRADVYFRAVPIGAGTHHVVFKYEPLTVRLGEIVSLGVWAILGAVLIRSGLRRLRP